MTDWREQAKKEAEQITLDLRSWVNITDTKATVLSRKIEKLLGVAQERIDLEVSLKETCIKVAQMQTKEVDKLLAEKKEMESLIEDNETMLCNCEEQRIQEGCHNKDCNYIEVRDKIDEFNVRHK